MATWGGEHEHLPAAAAAIDRVRQEIATRQADTERFKKFLQLASDAQDKMAYGSDLGGDEVAEEALQLFDVLTADDWPARLASSTLTADQKRQVRETAYITVVSLADFGVRWQREARSAQRSLDLLRRAEAWHEPTRAFFFVRAECYRLQKDAAAADEDVTRFKMTAARTAWDYYPPGHTAGWRGHLDEAIRSYRAALALQPNHFNSLFFLAMRLATDKINRRAEAVQLFTGCIALRPDHAFAYFNRAECYHKLGLLEDAEADYTAAIAAAASEYDRVSAYIFRRDFYRAVEWTEKFNQDEKRLIELGERLVERGKTTRDQKSLMAMHHLAALYQSQGEYTKAEPLFALALEVRLRVQGAEHADTLNTMNNLAGLYRDQNQLAQAEALDGKVLEVRRRILGEEHLETLNSMNNLACLYWSAKKLDLSVPLFEEVLKRSQAKLGPDHPNTLNIMANLGVNYRDAGRVPEGTALLEQAWAMAQKRPGPLPDFLTFIPTALGKTYDQAGRFADAAPLYREALETARKRHGAASLPAADALDSLGLHLLKQQKYADAEPPLRECLTIREQKGPDDWRTFDTKSLLGASLLGQKNYAEAEPLLLAGYEGLKQREERIPHSWGKVRLTEAIERLVQLYEATGQPEKAAEWRKKLPMTKSAKPAETKQD